MRVLPTILIASAFGCGGRARNEGFNCGPGTVAVGDSCVPVDAGADSDSDTDTDTDSDSDTDSDTSTETDSISDTDSGSDTESDTHVPTCPGGVAHHLGYCWVVADHYDEAHADACARLGLEATGYSIDVAWDADAHAEVSRQLGCAPQLFFGAAPTLWRRPVGDCMTYAYGLTYENYGAIEGDNADLCVFTCLEE